MRTFKIFGKSYLGFLILFLLLITSFASAQEVLIRGKVTASDTKTPIPGVNVIEKGTSNGVATDFDGNYEIKVKSSDAILEFTYVGFTTKEISIGDRREIDVVLDPNVQALDETVIVGFQNQTDKASLVSSVTSVNPEELKGPTSNLTQMMAGRVAGMVAYQRSGEPGADNSDFFIRGLGTFGAGKRNPLILIDGIESTTTDMARLQPDDIKSFSVLKDAAASAVYGARGANGVVLITTKMGVEGKVKFHFRSETRVSSNTKNFDFADNIAYMNLANEAALTRDPNAVEIYSRAKILGTANGNDPYAYPDNNWIDQLIKDYTVNEGLNLSASGGGEKARFYISGTYNVDNGVLKVDPINNFNSNIKLRNYSIRTNIDLDLTPTTEGIVRIYGQFDDYNGPVGGGGQIFNYAIWSNPVKFPAIYPDEYLPFIEHPLFGGSRVGFGSNTILVNPYAEMVRGYQTHKASTIQPQIEIKQDLDFLTEGLSARAMGYLRRYSYYDVSRQYNPFYYTSSIDPVSGGPVLTVLNDGGEGSIGTTGTEYLNYSEGNKNLDSRIYLETAINYSRTFNEKHAVSAMLINLISSYERGNSGSVQNSLASRNHGVSGSFTYGYDKRYLAEFNFGYNGSERFAYGHRYGFFPSFGVGYNISNEKFWDPFKDVISNLKIRGTYGWVGNDEIGDPTDRFFYLSNVNLNDGTYGASFGTDFNYYRNGINISRYSNFNIGWEKSEQINLGLDLEIAHDLNFTADIFRQRRSNILQDRSNIGATLGLTATPQTNFGKVESKGMDLSLDYNKQLSNDWWTQLRGNFTYATNEVLEYDEVTYPDELSYLSRIGENVTQRYGYIAERLFIDDAEVRNSPQQFGEYTGGDIKYRDVNGDGIINENDIVPLGYPTVPEIVYGFGGTVGYKNFDLSVFFQGAARTSFFINPENISPFVLNVQNGRGFQNGLLNIIAEDHWSEANRDSYSFWPRLSDTFIENNNRVSSWWMRDGSFLRLKTLEAGFTPSENFVNKLHLSNMRIYVSGTNLFLWSNFKLWDPEMGGNGLGYPIQSVYNFGVRIDI